MEETEQTPQTMLLRSFIVQCVSCGKMAEVPLVAEISPADIESVIAPARQVWFDQHAETCEAAP